jgi:hypothetical protein
MLVSKFSDPTSTFFFTLIAICGSSVYFSGRRAIANGPLGGQWCSDEAFWLSFLRFARRRACSQQTRYRRKRRGGGRQKKTYMEYCASGHGEDAKGLGPAASALKTPPCDLTTLAKRRGGKFPEHYVAQTIRFGKAVQTHGSVHMPVWGANL